MTIKKSFNNFKLSMLSLACMSAMSAAQADTIDGPHGDVTTQGTIVQAYDFTSHIQFGYDGWNLDNATVNIINAETGDAVAKSFDEATGTYSAMVDGETFYTAIDDGAGNVTGKLASKAWPKGEPAGVKVLTETTGSAYMKNGKPSSCIMSTAYHPYSDDPTITLPSGATSSDGTLNSAYPNPTMCDSAFQTHKRFKVSAQPAALTSGGIDMVFNVGTAGAATRYTVLQKLNNYTGKHLSGFKIQVGKGVGTGFTKSGDATIVSLSDGVSEKSGTGPDDIWGEEDRAAFSAGLFGPGDDHHSPGFFDNSARAGFTAVETTNVTKDEIASTGAMSSAYTTLFGGSKWLPGKYMPTGIFFDDDNNPDTDDQLVAWWGDNPNTSIEDYMWLKGAPDSYAPLTYIELNSYANNSQYYIGKIEDTVNLGLTYAVDVGDVVADGGKFTIRMIPIPAADSEQYVPGYMEEANKAPSSLVEYAASRSSSTFSTYDNTSLIAMILGFLGLGAWVARRKLSK